MNLWAKRRGQLSHRDLGNTIIPKITVALAECRNNGMTPRLIEKIGEVLDEWTRIQSDALELISTCTCKMSPKSLFCEAPLVYLDPTDASVLGDMIHLQWLQKSGILLQLSESLSLLRAADCYAAHLRDIPLLAENPGDCVRFLESLGNACTAIAKAFSNLPKEIEV